MQQDMVSFGDAWSKFWAGYFNFRGRASRSEYWWMVLVWSLASIGANLIDRLCVWESTAGSIFAAMVLLFCLVTCIPLLSVAVRRLHDSGHSGWWVLITLIPIIGPMICFIFSLLPSQPQENRYGSVPNLR